MIVLLVKAFYRIHLLHLGGAPFSSLQYLSRDGRAATGRSWPDGLPMLPRSSSATEMVGPSTRLRRRDSRRQEISDYQAGDWLECRILFPQVFIGPAELDACRLAADRRGWIFLCLPCQGTALNSMPRSTVCAVCFEEGDVSRIQPKQCYL